VDAKATNARCTITYVKQNPSLSQLRLVPKVGQRGQLCLRRLITKDYKDYKITTTPQQKIQVLTTMNERYYNNYEQDM
jgi:hypothetical protein